MRDRVKIYRPTREDDGAGGHRRVDPSPETLIDTVWAKVEVASSGEQFKASKLEQIVTHVAHIRYRRSLANLTDHVVEFKGDKMRVITCTNPDLRERFLKLTLRQGGEL